MNVFIVAEAGVNHNGDLQKALDLVDVAADAGVDAVKFQTFTAENLVTKFADTAEYQKKAVIKNKTQLEMLEKLELTKEMHFELFEYTNKKCIEFMSTAFDSDSLNFLINDLGLNRLKISSGDITNDPFLLEHAETGSDIILSTGISNLREIEQALSVIAFGLTTNGTKRPNRENFLKAFSSKEGQDALRKKVTLLHCTSEYPTPISEVNLKAINTLRDTFGLSVGFSDHSEGIIVPVMAVGLGAEVIEKHFTLDKDQEGPDHKASITPLELKSMVKAIRLAEEALGDGIKIPQEIEIKNKEIIRKSLCALKDIHIGEKYTSKNVAIKRPGKGMPPSKYWDLLGKTATVTTKEGEYIYE